ncbi:MAG: acyl-CoA dehydrogenase family protein [Polyangiaceae bacterium]
MFDYEKRFETVAEIARAQATKTDVGAFPEASLKALAENGFFGLISSPEVGGHGLGMEAAAWVIERLARECGSSAMVLTMHYAATVVIEQLGPIDIRRAIARGEHLSTLAFSEPGSRSHFWAPLGTAASESDGARLDGKKSFVTSARHADTYVWSSKPLAGNELSSLWLVPRTTHGLRIDAPFDGLGLRGNDSSPVTAEAARVPRSALLGEDGAGFGVMINTVLPWFNVLLTANSLGLMESAVEKVAGHVRAASLAHASSSLADLPTVRAYIARMRIATDQTRALLRDTIAAISTGRADATLRVLECKAASGESAITVTDLAMRVAGGAAFRKELGLERAFRDARASVVMGPTADVLYDFIGKAVCGLPLF